MLSSDAAVTFAADARRTCVALGLLAAGVVAGWYRFTTADTLPALLV
jgi:hypothetical protein